MSSKKQILDTLIDKYERSKAYKEGASYPRRIMIKLYDNGRSDLRSYNIENTEAKESFNKAIEELKKDEIVDFEWLKYESGNIISRVWLLPEKVNNAYIIAGRQPKLDKVEAIVNYIREISSNVKHKWIEEFFNDTCTIIEKKRSITVALPDNDELARDVLYAIRQIDSIDENEVLERVFSVRCFGDSKRFEKYIKKRVVTIIRKNYIDDPDNELSDEEVLRKVGIIKAPEVVEFCGNLTVCFNTGKVDYSPLKFGATINSFDIRNCNLIIGENITRVLFIENKANYLDYILNHKGSDDLVILHGGFYSPVKGLFFEKLFSVCNKSSVRFYHWGDIDLGGFKIFSRLKKNIIPDLIPYNMGIVDLENNRNFLVNIDDKYANKMLLLLKQPVLKECYDTIKYIALNKVKLEQEAFIREDV